MHELYGHGPKFTLITSASDFSTGQGPQVVDIEGRIFLDRVVCAFAIGTMLWIYLNSNRTVHDSNAHRLIRRSVSSVVRGRTLA